MYILFPSQCPLHFKWCNELTFALHFSSLVCFSYGHLLSGSSKKTHHCSAVRARLSHKSNTFLRPLTLSNGVGEWWKPFCIPLWKNSDSHNFLWQGIKIELGEKHHSFNEGFSHWKPQCLSFLLTFVPFDFYSAASSLGSLLWRRTNLYLPN